MEALPPVLSRDKTMEVLLESLFLPLPVYPASSPGDHEASTIQMASTRIPADDALRHSDRQIRIASRTCSFMKLLTEKINWRLGDLRLYLPKTATRQLAAKRKHEEMMLHEPQENTLTYLRRRQLIFISQAIRDYTNDGPGQNSFQLEDAENTALRIWTYLTRHFAKGESGTRSGLFSPTSRPTRRQTLGSPILRPSSTQACVDDISSTAASQDISLNPGRRVACHQWLALPATSATSRLIAL